MRAKRSLGQNFLVDPNIQRRIVDAVAAGPDDTVIEIGPGHGALTSHLAGAVGRLILIELDDHLAAALESRYRDRENVLVIHRDVLEVHPAEILEPGQWASGVDARTGAAGREGGRRGEGAAETHAQRLLVVGNIPYNITSPILFHLLEWRPAPAAIILMMQREVADRLLASPGSKEYGALTVGVRAAATVERLFNVSKEAFRPTPNVMSTVVRIEPRRGADGEPGLDPGTTARLRSLTRVAFGQRRKQLQKILRTAPGWGLDLESAEAALAEVGVAAAARPESLDPVTFIALADALSRRGVPLTEGAD